MIQALLPACEERMDNAATVWFTDVGSGREYSVPLDRIIGLEIGDEGETMIEYGPRMYFLARGLCSR
jgi:hypothetical protein